ncbi:hypothetical protein PHYBLDRAFT_67317 [Phycomyces blakesleeanus NRRL 1555(-)]|uniref:Uncharacterized protein n=1 Tax=Phycomyces blakesleeanus (strain ATCC 8743b / DSM 1359 / FGSC 10004 / NBRC 33097 / NRRL 1555) TaxID=763407 RepID=A0A162ZJ84_PHYB8|nr:hypothetical protein PHYBLDRAFT_67317 [Phycomyces blakesleeanus NRRL 1555(-)]OAD67181.1 hypothetical protein PHYBLDRAFT_67317 [Phycomyces blakesleeanus NRRL 1555(-)]|eukprot:XP_018285221.1 hypothetical protein PHYBLDRAFT_67317 [Phycomyces blakesleeanus NRRL 1555(-)]
MYSEFTKGLYIFFLEINTCTVPPVPIDAFRASAAVTKLILATVSIIQSLVWLNHTIYNVFDNVTAANALKASIDTGGTVPGLRRREKNEASGTCPDYTIKCRQYPLQIKYPNLSTKRFKGAQATLVAAEIIPENTRPKKE